MPKIKCPKCQATFTAEIDSKGCVRCLACAVRLKLRLPVNTPQRDAILSRTITTAAPASSIIRAANLCSPDEKTATAAAREVHYKNESADKSPANKREEPAQRTSHVGVIALAIALLLVGIPIFILVIAAGVGKKSTTQNQQFAESTEKPSQSSTPGTSRAEPVERRVRQVVPEPDPQNQRHGALDPVVAGTLCFTLEDLEKVLGKPDQKNGHSILYSGKLKATKTDSGIDIAFCTSDNGLLYAAGLFSSRLFTKTEADEIMDFVDHIGKSKVIGRFTIGISRSLEPRGWRRVEFTPGRSTAKMP